MKDDDPALLVVDDEEFNRTLILRHLKKEGYDNVEVAEDGKQAVDMVRSNNFDLILLDIEMPEMDGYGVLEQLKSDMRLRDIPVIMISSIDDMDSIVKCIELGADDYLPKPFDPVLLRARLGACLDKKRLLDEKASYLSQIKDEKKKSDELLNVILPTAAANELKRNGRVEPRRHDNVAILFCDVVGFTSYCDDHPPEEVVAYLQNLIEKFEEITKVHGMEKIKTIGDEFMATAGLLTENKSPLLSVIGCGLEMGAAARDIEPNWEVRTGVHLGSVVAGIVGRDKYQFDVWGDTVNIAARMTGQGSPRTVAMTYETWLQVEDECQGKTLGRIDVKGKGEVEIIECYGLQ